MINNFEMLVEQAYIYEQSEKVLRVGLYPGAYKPPHIGHYQAAVNALSKNDVVFVLMSGQCRGQDECQVTGDQSEAIWDIYKQDIGDPDLHVVRVDNSIDPDTGGISTVITATYDIVHLLNNSGIFEPSSRFTQPHPTSRKIYDKLKGMGSDKFEVTLHAGAEDFNGRYSGFPFERADETERFTGKDVINIRKGFNQRLASASSIRPFVADYRKQNIQTTDQVRERVLSGALKYDDFASVRKNLPGDDDLKDQVIDKLLSK